MERSSGSHRLGNLSVPFRLSPRWQGVAQSLNGFPSGEVAAKILTTRLQRYSVSRKAKSDHRQSGRVSGNVGRLGLAWAARTRFLRDGECRVAV
jgi:hypothetical protein